MYIVFLRRTKKCSTTFGVQLWARGQVFYFLIHRPNRCEHRRVILQKFVTLSRNLLMKDESIPTFLGYCASYYNFVAKFCTFFKLHLCLIYETVDQCLDSKHMFTSTFEKTEIICNNSRMVGVFIVYMN